MFIEQEAGLLGPVAVEPFEIPVYSRPKVARDRHVEVARGIYSVPGELIGQRLLARADTRTVKLYRRGQLIKVHPRVEPGRRHTDPADLPSEVSIYAMRDLDALARRAGEHGEQVGAYAAALLDHPLPWTKMCQVYRLLGLVRRHGADRVDAACARALDVETVNVGLIERMLLRGFDGDPSTHPSTRSTENIQLSFPVTATSPVSTVVPAAGSSSATPPSSPPAGPHSPLNTGGARYEHHPPEQPPAAATAATQRIEVSADLKYLLRRLKLGRLLDTLPERLALARQSHLPHHEFLEMLLTDEVIRRDHNAIDRRAREANLDPTMTLQAWDDSSAVAFDRTLWAELCSLRFLDPAHNVLIMGPVGVGKTFLANALGHAAVRRKYSVHLDRADRLFKRLRAARLDHSHDEAMRKLHRVQLLIIDDLALHPLGVDQTNDFYELIVERHRHASTIITSNREPPEMLTMMADPLLAQSALDRLQSAAYELIVEGESYRQRQRPQPGRTPPNS